jgi:C-terminal processing protease CtpA/Prc
MKKFIAILALAIVLVEPAKLNAQNQQQVKNLSTLAKLWGFLKYYHPSAAKGNPDWDKELLRMIPLAKQAASDAEFNTLITGWYHSLPQAAYASSITQIKADTIVRTFDETDIAGFGLSKPLQDTLMRLYLYHLPDSSKYINNRERQYTYDYVFHNENPYNQPAFPNEEYRLLGLFRYWNIIEYFYPYKKINTHNWDKILPAFIPKFIQAGDSTEYRKTFLVLTTQIKDSHSFFDQPYWTQTHRLNTPFDIVYIEGRYYISATHYDSLMHAFGITTGDEIVGINNKPIAERVNELKPITTGTNELSFYRNIAYNLVKMDTNRLMRLRIKRREQVLEKTIHLFTWKELAAYKKNTQPLWNDMGKGVWLVRFCDITKPDTLKQLFKDLQQAKTVIWDMRGYPSFPVVQAMGRGLFAAPPVTTISYNSILEFPGALTKRSNASGYSAIDTMRLSLYKGSMIILVNEQTQSLSESVAYELSFRPNTIVMGRQTAGTTGNITSVEYPGGISASYTGVGVEGLNGRFKEGKGVKIDKEIRLNAQSLTAYADYMLEMALKEAVSN